MIKVQFISVQTLKDRSQLQNNIDEKLLNIAIREFQELELKRTLGRVEYERLQDVILGSVADPAVPLTSDDTELMTYITPVMIYGALMYSISPIHNKLTNAGAKVDDFQNSTNADLAVARADYAFKMDGFKRDLIEYRTEKAAASQNKPKCNGSDDTTFNFTGMSIPDSQPDRGKQYEQTNYKTGGFGFII